MLPAVSGAGRQDHLFDPVTIAIRIGIAVSPDGSTHGMVENSA
jgi:hypothetical protein